MVKQQIKKKNEQYAVVANKGIRRVVFHPGDQVWVHMPKERFPTQQKSKLQPRGNGLFQVFAKFNDNAYKIYQLSEYNVSATFNVSNLSLFNISDNSWMNLFEEGENDGDHKLGIQIMWLEYNDCLNGVLK